MAATMLGSAMAGMLARIPMHPLDTVKAKMQVEMKNPYRNIVHALRRTVRLDGFRGLYAGTIMFILFIRFFLCEFLLSVGLLFSVSFLFWSIRCTAMVFANNNTACWVEIL